MTRETEKATPSEPVECSACGCDLCSSTVVFTMADGRRLCSFCWRKELA